MDHSIRVQLAGKSLASTEVVVVPCFEKQAPETDGLAKHFRSAASAAVERRGWKGTLGQTATIRSSAPGRPFVAVVGLGSRSAYDVFRLGAWLDRGVTRASSDGFTRAVFRVPPLPLASSKEGALFVTRRLAAAAYRFEEYRSKAKKKPFGVVRVVPAPGDESAFRAVSGIARNLAEGVAFCRTLANTPPNIADPEWMATRAGELASEFDLATEILGPRDMEERGMGGILAVGQGSTKPPRMVRLSWGEGEPNVALVGKGVTFDSGGLSLKPPSSMDEMKFDKSGACTVLGLARAVAGARLPGRYSCYLALAENMPDGVAYRPGDIVRCYNGKTVEILNTDAEGRMLLADALAWAEEDGAATIVDFATLTGACVVALGHSGGGLFAPDDDLAADLLDAADASGERLWRLPLWPEFEKQMQGQHGDLRNTGGRWAGASTAAAFLAQFVEKRERWAHLDIAGPAYHGRARKSRFGATGYGVSLAFLWLARRAGIV